MLGTEAKARGGSEVNLGDTTKPRLGSNGGSGPGGPKTRHIRRPLNTMVYVERVASPTTARIARDMVDAT